MIHQRTVRIVCAHHILRRRIDDACAVRGDIHDIGKNIVKVLLENYSFDVIDLGKDVSPETIALRACREDVEELCADVFVSLWA